MHLAVFLERPHHAADALVHAVDHGGINFHAACLPRFVLHLCPVAFRGRKLRILGDQSHLPHAQQTRLPHGLVACVILALVFGRIFWQRVHGPMCGGVGHVEEEGLVLLRAGILINETHRVVADRIRIIILLRLVLRIGKRRDHRIITRQRPRIIKAARSSDRAVEAVKAALQRPVELRAFGHCMLRDVPFAHRISPVTRRFQHLCDGHAALVQIPPIPLLPTILHHVPNPRLMRIQPRQQRRPRGAAAPGIVELTEPYTALRQPVKIRRLNLPAVAPEIREAHVIRHDEDDVGRCGLQGCSRQQERRE